MSLENTLEKIKHIQEQDLPAVIQFVEATQGLLNALGQESVGNKLDKVVEVLKEIEKI